MEKLNCLSNMENKKIVIIDDDITLNNKISNLLRNFGFNVFSAYDGLSGLDLVKQERPRLIILDITMPKMDGITVLKNIKEDEAVNNTIVIILTNISMSRVVRYATELGVQEYLIKPNHSFGDIVERVKKYF